MIKLRLLSKKGIQREFIAYFLISILALTVDLVSFSFCIRNLFLPWAISSIFSFSAGILVTYFLSIFFVFSDRKVGENQLKEFIIFLTIGIGGLLVTQLALLIGIELFKIQPEISKLLAAGLTFLYNFTLRKFFLFTKK